MIPSKHRFSLKNRKAEFDSSSKTASSSFFKVVVLARKDPGSESRFCILVSKRISPLSVHRHHYKRLVAAAVRSRLSLIPPGRDFLIILRRAIRDQDLRSIETQLKTLLS